MQNQKESKRLEKITQTFQALEGLLSRMVEDTAKL